MTPAFIGLGSNLGDRLANLVEACRRLAEVEGIEIDAASRVYETAPVGPSQPDYLNAVIRTKTVLAPRELLDACLDVERSMGRVRAERWGPRVVDLDVLSHGDARSHTPVLTLPHPRMHERGFVMVPLLELERHPVLPEGRRAADLRPDPGWLDGVRIFAPALPIP